MTQGIGPLDPFGTDVLLAFTSTGVGDMTTGADEVTGVQLVAQRILCRITTRRGTVIDCPNDCLDIRDSLRAGVTSQQQAAFQGQLQTEIAKEQCVTAVAVSVVWNLAAGSMVISISVQTAAGPFDLTISVSALTLAVLMNGQPFDVVA